MGIRRKLKLIMLIRNKKTSYPKLIEFLFGEAPPKNHDFFSRINRAPIKNITHSKVESKTKKPIFSVVVATYNRGYCILNALEAIVSQKNIPPEEYEIIVVNDGSTDNTSEKLAEFLAYKNIPICMAINLETNYGPSVARNIGVARSNGIFIAFTDDDCIVPENWLHNFKKTIIAHPEISGVGGWIKLNEKLSTLYDKIIIDLRLPYSKYSLTSTTYHPYNLCGDTANVCYKKTAIMAVGGFNHYFRFPTTEDWEMKIRMHDDGRALSYAADRPVISTKQLNAKTYRKLWLKHGWGCFLMSTIHPKTKYIYNFSLNKALKRTIREISAVRTTELPFTKLIEYSWLLAVRNFFLWLGKYWVPLFELKN